MNNTRIMVIGAGQMGTGIAQVFIHNGFNVTLSDHKRENILNSVGKVKGNLTSLVEKGKITKNEMEKSLSLLTFSHDINVAGEMDLIIEAISEDFDLKKDLFSKLSYLVNVNTIIASNTSSLSISELGNYVLNPSRFIGMHFFNPVPVMGLIEIVKGNQTADDVSNQIFDLAERIGKSPIFINDSPGFVLNRILIPMINEAIYTVYEGVADFLSVDKVMKLGANHPMGPISLADFIGLDTCLSIMETLYNNFGDDKYAPCPLLKEYVNCGKLGRKTGQGFFNYS
jgi:3-hydroxybutyryl-CoA dehydrogenase